MDDFYPNMNSISLRFHLLRKLCIIWFEIIKVGVRMLPISEELKEKLQNINRSLREVYPQQNIKQAELRERLSSVGEFFSFEKWQPEKWKNWLGDRTLVGVDGSVNSTPGSPLRTISVFQALAKSTHGEEKWAADVQTPLLPGNVTRMESQAAREAQLRGAVLSSLELRIALQAMQEWRPRVVMMDGSLLHFLIDDHEGWSHVSEWAQSHDIYMLGVAEEIGTYRLVQEVLPEHSTWSDRDLLYGLLEIGEAFIWEDWSPAGSQMWKMAMRTSQSPIPVGLDGLKSQKDVATALVQLAYSLTPEQGRGIPFWLDIVDNQVRVTNPLVQTLIEEYIDPDIRHHVLMLKRSDRII